MKPKEIIRLSKRFLIVAALIILIIGSSVAIIPVRAPSGSKIVYVAICVDSETSGFGGIGSTDPHPTLNVGSYSRTLPMTVAAVFDSGFRNSHRDSFGNVFKMSWFAEMDYLYAQSNFVWADGSPAGVSGYTAIRDLLMNNWRTEIQTYGDSVEYHHHFMIYDGTWKRYDNGPDAGYPEYQMYALDHMIIDRNFYPSSWRSGWWIMPPALSSWLEQWMPFDYTPTYTPETGLWYPFHPSGMDRWQTKCPYSPNAYASTQAAFAYASEHGSAVYSICTHNEEDMKSQVDWLQWCLNHWDAAETAYPNVSFKYVSAREAMQLALGFTDFTPPTFTLTPSGGTYTIVSSETLWKNHPYIALKYTDGTYGHMSATPTGSNTWTVTPPINVSVIGVAGSDLYGNPGVTTATVTQDQYVLTVDTVGSGSVTKSPDQATYASGTVVTLTATPTAGWSFSAWSGGVSGSVNPTTITMNGNKAVTATFTQLQYTLTVSVSPVEGGSVSHNNTGPYHYGDRVQLTAVPNTGWVFSSWSGDLTGSDNPSVITMNGNKSVTATFTQLQYTLTVNISPTGSGSVSRNNTGPYNYGDKVQLTANPTVGWSFSSWSGDLTGSANPAVITMNGNKTVTATFTQLQYTLTVTVSPTGSGSVSLNNSGPYHYGDVVELTAVPAAGWSFSGWNGDATGSLNPVSVIINGTTSVTATFTQNTYRITVTQGANGVISPETIDVEYGSDKAFTITPDNGYHIFDVVVDDIPQGAVSSYLFRSVVANHTISASFAIDVYTPFSIVSNSTISELAFNSTSQVLSFTASGRSGTTGFSNVTISKTLIADVSGLEVYLDGTKTSYVVSDLTTSWLIYITYQHSTHKIAMSFAPPPSARADYVPYIALAAILGFMVALVLTVFVRRRGKSSQSEERARDRKLE